MREKKIPFFAGDRQKWENGDYAYPLSIFKNSFRPFKNLRWEIDRKVWVIRVLLNLIRSLVEWSEERKVELSFDEFFIPSLSLSSQCGKKAVRASNIAVVVDRVVGWSQRTAPRDWRIIPNADLTILQDISWKSLNFTYGWTPIYFWHFIDIPDIVTLKQCRYRFSMLIL